MMLVQHEIAQHEIADLRHRMGSRSQLLLDKAKNGSASDVGQLLSIYTQYLKTLANHQLDRRVRQRVSPSDLVQDTLLEAHRDFPNFRGTTIAELVSWLRRILIHNLIRASEHHLHTEKRDARREISLQHLAANLGSVDSPLEAALKSPVGSPSAYIRGQEQLTELERALSTLPNEQRQVVMLRHLDGLAFNDIAQRLGRSSGACRMLWLRAMDDLRERLQERRS